jgi:hypothetical protein
VPGVTIVGRVVASAFLLLIGRGRVLRVAGIMTGCMAVVLLLRHFNLQTRLPTLSVCEGPTELILQPEGWYSLD